MIDSASTLVQKCNAHALDNAMFYIAPLSYIVIIVIATLGGLAGFSKCITVMHSFKKCTIESINR